MKALFKKIEPEFGSSFAIKKMDCSADHPAPQWHQHPEFELVYLSRGVKGRRHIGHHCFSFKDGDLIFLGSDLPHYGYFEKGKPGQHKIVLQLRRDFLGAGFLNQPEMLAIRGLFERAKGGIAFHGKIKDEIGAALEALLEMENFDRLLNLLRLLNKLAGSENYSLLQSDGFTVEVNPVEKERIRTVYGYVEKHFHEAIPLDDIAQQVNMTVPAFCRYLKKLTGKTFTRFVNEFRIAHATKLLADESLSISEISYASGFNSFSHFNKLFKEITGQRPSAYRKVVKHIV